MTERLISVIINNYNYKNYLPEAVESVLKQTYDNWELIIVDDGSTDGSDQVILGYEKKYPAKIHSVLKKNGGQASAFNEGFRHCAGDIICFLDSDDMFLGRKLEEAASRCPEDGFLLHGWRYSNGKGETPYYRAEGAGLSFFEILLARGNIWPTSQIVFSRSILEQILPVPEKPFRISADACLMFLCAGRKEPVLLKEELGIYRVHGANAWYGSATKAQNDALFRHILKEVNVRLISACEKPVSDLWPYVKKVSTVQDGYEVPEGGKYIIYGTGGGGKKLKEYVEYCGAGVLAFADSNPAKWGAFHNKVPVISPQEIKSLNGAYRGVLIGSVDYREAIANTLNGIGLREKDDYAYLEVVLNSYADLI